MKLLQAVVGIDPSGRRLALAARGGPLGRAVPPAVTLLRSEREQGLLGEAEAALHDFVARNGLAGSPARLCIPAERVFTARAVFPPLRDKDLGPALELELERLFPFPSSRLLFGWRRQGKAEDGKVALVVVATPSDYIEKWQEAASRAGLALVGAVPSGWALSAACAAAGAPEGPETTAVLRETGAGVECVLLSGREPFFCGFRPCAGEEAPAEAYSLIESGLGDAPALPDAPIRLLAPGGLLSECARRGEEAGLPIRLDGDFGTQAARAFALPESGDGAAAAWETLGAWGAAIDGSGLDLLRPQGERVGSRAAGMVAGALAAFTLVLAVAWPGMVLWKAKAELAGLDARIAALRPAVADVEETLADLAGLAERTEALAHSARGREEALLVLQDLTDRLPHGTWLTGLRVEDRKVEIDGLSPSASEIFPLLTRDGKFRNVEFASPITRQPDNIERFQIRAEFVPAPAQEARPGQGP